MAAFLNHRRPARDTRTRNTTATSRAALLAQRPLGHFDRDRLPDPGKFYEQELGDLKGLTKWKTARCAFHGPDKNPSLSVNVETGGYHCHACGASGGDLIAFIRQRDGLSFVDACKRLGCWVEGRA